MTLSIVLAGLLLGTQEPKPVLPGESGYVLQRAREMVHLATCREAEGRMDLLLAQSQERLREREAMGTGPFSRERERVARSLGESYRHLALEGGAGTIECGVAEGRDMKAAQARYLEALSGNQERWERVIASLPPGERSGEEPVLRVPEEAPKRSREAEAAGLDFLRKERERRESAPALPAPRTEPPKPTPAPVPAAVPPPAPPPPGSAPPRAEPQISKPEEDHPRKEDTPDASKHPEHHSHPHRPHH
jgi:hypothetical protein